MKNRPPSQERDSCSFLCVVAVLLLLVFLPSLPRQTSIEIVSLLRCLVHRSSGTINIIDTVEHTSSPLASFHNPPRPPRHPLAAPVPTHSKPTAWPSLHGSFQEASYYTLLVGVMESVDADDDKVDGHSNGGAAAAPCHVDTL